jgi:actin-related protein
VHEWIHYAIDNCSGEKFEKELWNHIVLSGENTKIPGFSARLKHELFELAPADVQVRLISPPDLNPKNLAYVGT